MEHAFDRHEPRHAQLWDLIKHPAGYQAEVPFTNQEALIYAYTVAFAADELRKLGYYGPAHLGSVCAWYVASRYIEQPCLGTWNGKNKRARDHAIKAGFQYIVHSKWVVTSKQIATHLLKAAIGYLDIVTDGLYRSLQEQNLPSYEMKARVFASAKRTTEGHQFFLEEDEYAAQLGQVAIVAVAAPMTRKRVLAKRAQKPSKRRASPIAQPFALPAPPPPRLPAILQPEPQFEFDADPFLFGNFEFDFDSSEETKPYTAAEVQSFYGEQITEADMQSFYHGQDVQAASPDAMDVLTAIAASAPAVAACAPAPALPKFTEDELAAFTGVLSLHAELHAQTAGV